MTTAEMLAIAVLKGDESAITPLLDCLLETLPDRERQLLPVKTFKVESNNVRAILYVNLSLGGDVRIDEGLLNQQVNSWLGGNQKILTLHGFSHVELYEFPLAANKLAVTKSLMNENWDDAQSEYLVGGGN